MRCPPSPSAVRSPAFSIRSWSCESASARIALSSRSNPLDFEAALEMKRSPVLLRSYRGPMEYVKRLSNKEATESGEPERREKTDQTALRSVKRTLGSLERTAHQFAKSVGIIGKESVDPDFEAPAQFC